MIGSLFVGHLMPIQLIPDKMYEGAWENRIRIFCVAFFVLHYPLKVNHIIITNTSLSSLSSTLLWSSASAESSSASCTSYPSSFISSRSSSLPSSLSRPTAAASSKSASKSLLSSSRIYNTFWRLKRPRKSGNALSRDSSHTSHDRNILEVNFAQLWDGCEDGHLEMIFTSKCRICGRSKAWSMSSNGM